MKTTAGIAAVLLLSARVLFAQTGGVSVDISLNQKQYLLGEELEAAVKVTNLSGQTLELGQDNSWLQFTIEERNGSTVPLVSEPNIAGAFSLKSSLAGTKRVNLAPHFAFRNPGSYQVKATLKVSQWGLTIQSQPMRFEVIGGTVLKAIPFGVPLPAGTTNRPPEVRRYVLQQANYLKENLFLYARITDGDGLRTSKVVRLGPMTSFSKPEAQLDSESNLHVLFQAGARGFLYTCLDPDGAVKDRQTFDIGANRPVLRDLGNGQIGVAGGVRRISSSELEAQTATNPATNPPPSHPVPEPSQPDPSN